MSQTGPPYPEGRNLLAGKTVLVTAAAGSGIGFATARRCLEEGASVMISDSHERRLGKAADELMKIDGKRPASRLCNVTVEADVRALVKAALDQLGRIDVLINNAGLGGTVNVVDMTDEQWHTVLDVTLTGTFRMTRAVLPHMLERRAGVMALTRCSALEAADSGVRINAVAPSLATHEFLTKVMPQELLDKLTQREAFGRGAEPWEVANVIVFLASDYSSYMTGECVAVSNQHA